MSTEIESSETERQTRMTRSGDEVILWLDDMHMEAGSGRFMVEIRHFRADFLAAVAKECDVIVVDRAGLPKVTGDRVGGYEVRRMHVGGQAYRNGDEARESACDYLALAEYLDAHPPVDEAQVEALAALIAQAPYRDSDYVGIAHRIIATGRVQVTL